MKRQGGGTFLGLVLGIVLGLGVALAVAVYVTKVPVPFLNKGQTRSADQDAAEARKNKDWDPNSPLYGKNPARQSAGTVGGDGASAPAPDAKPAKPETPSDQKPDAKAAAKSDAKPEVKPVLKGGDTKAATSSDPLGDLARAKAGAAPAAAPAPAASGADPFDYYIQAGAYRSNEDAETQKAKLAMMGWEARVTEREQAGRTVFRVRVGPFSKRDDAERIKDKLDNAGLDTTMVRVQR